MKWHIIDENFRANKRSFVIQSVIAGLAVAVALLAFDIVRNPVVIGAFGASAFVAFTEPHKRWTGPRCLIGGYIIGLLVGGSVHYLTEFSIEHYWLLKIIHILAGALAVSLAMFFMSVTDTEHAPASGIALGLVINDWDYIIIFKILVGIIIISLIQRALKRWMIDIV